MLSIWTFKHHRPKAFSAAHLFPDERGSLPVDSSLIVVVDVKLREQDLIFICSQSSLGGDRAPLQKNSRMATPHSGPTIVLYIENKERCHVDKGTWEHKSSLGCEWLTPTKHQARTNISTTHQLCPALQEFQSRQTGKQTDIYTEQLCEPAFRSVPLCYCKQYNIVDIIRS